MNDIETIGAAIVRLESWRGLWVHPKVSGAIAAQARLRGEMASSAVGIVTLTDDAVVNAQLDVLNAALADSEPDEFATYPDSRPIPQSRLLKVTASGRAAVALANAILGDAR